MVQRDRPRSVESAGHGEGRFWALGLVFFFCFASASEDPMEKTKISVCPATPNCVSSLSGDREHYVRPMQLEATAEIAWEKLKLVLGEERGIKIVAEDKPAWYLRAEATSRVFRFVDDVEFQIRPEQKVIHVRSASRVGYWDLGVNRRRAERIRERLKSLDVVSG
jgi:uncharacterized protein (DUF1499 family)